jgi:Na+-driven multidrug efflux pump
MKYGFWTQAGLNILLDYALIFGHFGLPEMGFNGAAVASIIAEFAGMVVVVGIILFKKYDVKFTLFRHLRFNAERAGLIFRQSLPLVAQWLISILAWLLFYIFIEHLGKRPLAISNTMRNIFGLFGIFVWAFASTTNAMVSNIIGQNKKEQVIHLVNKIARLSIGFTFILCAFINLVPQLFFSLYHLDKSFIGAAIPVLRMVTCGMMVMSFATVWLNAVTGTGNTRINLAIEIAAIILYTLYIYLALKYWNLGLLWGWASEALYWGSIFILSFTYIKKGNWRKKEL